MCIISLTFEMRLSDGLSKVEFMFQILVELNLLGIFTGTLIYYLNQ